MIGTWSLPGPAAAVGRILTSVLRDRVLVVHSPRGGSGLHEALCTHVYTLSRTPIAIEASSAVGFHVALCALIGSAETVPVAVLTGSEPLRGAVVILTASGALDADVQSFARIAARLQEDLGPCLLVVSSDTQARVDDSDPHELRGVVGPLDSAAYAAWLPRSGRPLFEQFVASVAVEVAAWDVELLDRLTALPLAQAFRPDQHVAAWCDGRAVAWSGLPPRWEVGSLDRWGGVDVEHPAWLAANRPHMLEKRVWRGQLSTVLPWIEDHRMRLIERNKRLLRPSGPSDDIALLDWGPLVLQLKARDGKRAQTMSQFRNARNELAHGRPLGWDHIRACIAGSADLIDAC